MTVGTPGRSAVPNLWIGLVLAAVTLAVYAPVRHFEFITMDDPESVSGNPNVQEGITPDSLRWAFNLTDIYVKFDNWHPLTRLSHIVAWQLFQADAGPHHVVNLLFHVAASLILFAFLLRATGARWQSAFAAAVFALHPLHVESVVWVSERKDVMSAFFLFLTLWTWTGYIQRPSRSRYLAALLAFALGLLSKPMIVTLPFLLLLLDRWPFGRAFSWKLVTEKLPFFALAAFDAGLTVFAQRDGGGLRSLSQLPLGLRLENALLTFVIYISDTVWPVGLSAIYVYPTHLPAWQVLAAGLAVGAVSVAVLRVHRRYPWLAVGWLWYLGTLVPVIGLVQQGPQPRADHYMYIPMVGLSIMLAWSAAGVAQGVARHWPRTAPLLAPLAGTACLALAAAAWFQIQYWKNTETLWRHATAVTKDNYLAANLLAGVISRQPGRMPEAVAAYRAAVKMKPDFGESHVLLAAALFDTGEKDEAILEYNEALRINPGSAEARFGLGSAFLRMGRFTEAIGQFGRAVEIQPDNAAMQTNLGVALMSDPGRLQQALGHLEKATRIDPDSVEAQKNLGLALARIPGRRSEAIAHLRAALQIAFDPQLERFVAQLEAGEKIAGFN